MASISAFVVSSALPESLIASDLVGLTYLDDAGLRLVLDELPEPDAGSGGDAPIAPIAPPSRTSIWC